MAAATDRTEYWRTYLSGANPCNFPSLVEGINVKLHRVQLPVELPDSDINIALEKFSIQSGVSVLSIFKAAWAIVLKSYTGSGATCFGSIVGHDTRDEFGICSASIEDVNSMLEILQTVQEDSLKSAPHLVFSLSEIESFRGLDG